MKSFTICRPIEVMRRPQVNYDYLKRQVLCGEEDMASRVVDEAVGA